VRIAPSVGPTQGVQAIANAALARIGPARPARCMSPSTRHSRFIAGTKRAVTNPTPSMMMTTAATFSSVAR
jgi:hypothetical protein